ncbi:unnamed protein product [Chrysoparadoxa australica]
MTKEGGGKFHSIAPFWVFLCVAAKGSMGLEQAQSDVLLSKRFSSHRQCTTWELPINTFVGAVRVQAEGVKMLSLLRVEVIKGGGAKSTQKHIEELRQALVRYMGKGISARVIKRVNFASWTGAQPTRSMFISQEKPQQVDSSDGPSAPSESGSTSEQLRYLISLLIKRLKAYYRRGSFTCLSLSDSSVSSRWNNSQSTGSTQTSLGDRPFMAHASFSKGHGATATTGTTGAPGGVSGRGTIPSKGAAADPCRNVESLYQRAMVGYDWVGDFQASKRASEEPFTTAELGALEELYLSMAVTPGDTDQRPSSVTECPGARVDAQEMCGDLRWRLQLQVQTKAQLKSTMLNTIRESPTLCIMFMGGILEQLPDAFARIEANLDPALRPMSLSWYQFLAVIEQLMKGSLSGIATIFEAKHDEKLDFLLMRTKRPPTAIDGNGAVAKGAQPYGIKTRPATIAVGRKRGGERKGQSSRLHLPSNRSFLEQNYSGARYVPPHLNVNVHVISSLFLYPYLSPKPSIGHTSLLALTVVERYHVRVRIRAIFSLATDDLLPSPHHCCLCLAREQRLQHQRELVLRADPPDILPTCPYKRCGLCQLHFPVDSLHKTVSYKVLGALLNSWGVQAGRFERKKQQISSYHRLPVCVFCSQFFHPDAPGGLVTATPESKALKSSGLVPFFDDRFTGGQKGLEEWNLSASIRQLHDGRSLRDELVACRSQPH